MYASLSPPFHRAVPRWIDEPCTHPELPLKGIIAEKYAGLDFAADGVNDGECEGILRLYAGGGMREILSVVCVSLGVRIFLRGV